MSRNIDWNKLNYEDEEFFEITETIKPVQKIKKKVKPEDQALPIKTKKKNDRKLSIHK